MKRILFIFAQDFFYKLFPFSKYHERIWKHELVEKYFVHFYKTSLPKAQTGYAFVTCSMPLFLPAAIAYGFLMAEHIESMYNGTLFKEPLFFMFLELFIICLLSIIIGGWGWMCVQAIRFNTTVHFEMNCWYTAAEHIDNFSVKSQAQILTDIGEVKIELRERLRKARRENQETKKLGYQLRELTYLETRLTTSL
jgi:hypothetical protein